MKTKIMWETDRLGRDLKNCGLRMLYEIVTARGCVEDEIHCGTLMAYATYMSLTDRASDR